MQSNLLIVFTKLCFLLIDDVFLVIFQSLCDVISLWCNHILHDLQFDRLLFLNRHFAFMFIILLFLSVLVVIKDINIMPFELEFNQLLDLVIVLN